MADEINNPAVQVAELGKQYTFGSVTLEFFGDKHGVISPDYPVAQNIGVLVNDSLYYPGDSLVDCTKPYQVLAIPTMAPWLKFSEAQAFLQSSVAQQVFPTHNGFINADGQALYDRLLGGTCETLGKKYTFIAPGQDIEV